MALSEGGIGWIPYFLERADFTHEHHHEWTYTDFHGERPSDLFKRHIICCFIDDQFGVKNLDYMNTDMIAYECDYPHRSEEHTSELQSLMRISYAVFCLKKNTCALQLIHIPYTINRTDTTPTHI